LSATRPGHCRRWPWGEDQAARSSVSKHTPCLQVVSAERVACLECGQVIDLPCRSMLEWAQVRVPSLDDWRPGGCMGAVGLIPAAAVAAATFLVPLHCQESRAARRRENLPRGPGQEGAPDAWRTLEARRAAARRCWEAAHTFTA